MSSLSNQDIALIIEDFRCLGVTNAEIAIKHGLPQYTVSKYTRMLFTKKLTTDTEIRVFKSKV